MSSPGPMSSKPGPMGGKPGPMGTGNVGGAGRGVPGPGGGRPPGGMPGRGGAPGGMPGGGAGRPGGIPGGAPGGMPGGSGGAPKVQGPKASRKGFDHGAAERPTSKLAIASVATGVFAPVVGMVLGIMAKVKLKKNENFKGKKLATLGIVVSVVSLLLQGAFGYFVYSEVTRLAEQTALTAEAPEQHVEEMSVRLGYCTDLRDTLAKLTSSDQKDVVRGMLIMAESDSKNAEVYQQAYESTQEKEKSHDAAALKSALTEDIRACG